MVKNNELTQTTLNLIAAGYGVLSRLCFRFVRRWVKKVSNSSSLHEAAWLQAERIVSLFKFILVTLFLDLHHSWWMFPSSSQETSARSWNSCNYPWCSSRPGLSSLPQLDSSVSVQEHAGHKAPLPSGGLSSVWNCNLSFICVWQRYQSRKCLADRARAGQTSRFWFCLHCLSCQLLCWDSILVCKKKKLL